MAREYNRSFLPLMCEHRLRGEGILPAQAAFDIHRYDA
jgi:hypothetical protein